MKFGGARQAGKTTHIQSALYATTYYGLLGVPVAATLEQIEARFKELAEKLHPDKVLQWAGARRTHADCVAGGRQRGCPVCEATVQFAQLTEARATLRDRALRKTYDTKLQLGGLRWCSSCNGKGKTNSDFKKSNRSACAKCEGRGCV